MTENDRSTMRIREGLCGILKEEQLAAYFRKKIVPIVQSVLNYHLKLHYSQTLR